MEIVELDKVSGDPIWDEEETKLIYAYPIPQDKAILKNNAALSKNFTNKLELQKVGPFLPLKAHILTKDRFVGQ